uniref:Uncharacterized protein n=1 Tax=Arundo donax TaxID=35708 RepID=A0A0A9FAP5_ARUDO
MEITIADLRVTHVQFDSRNQTSKSLISSKTSTVVQSMHTRIVICSL